MKSENSVSQKHIEYEVGIRFGWNGTRMNAQSEGYCGTITQAQDQTLKL